MVALILLAIVTLATVPLLVTGAKAANAAKLHTQAKNLAQQRLESMRDLEFHVDRQNGPFVDMLDVYYTDVSTTPQTHTRAGDTLTGVWVPSGGVSPQPSTGSFYKITIGQLAADPRFSQEIDTQFLDASGNVVPSSSFSNYNSQVEGRDQPPSLLTAVTVTTTWKDHGVTHKFTTYTRIADGRGLTASLTSQGRGEALRLTSAGPTGNALTVDLGLAEANGSQSTGSVASADVRALYAVDAAGSTFPGATGVASSPNGSSTGSAQVNTVTSGSGCGWVSSGKTVVSNVTAAVSGGLPQVPLGVDTASPPANQATAQLLTAGSGNPCGSFAFANQSTAYDAALMLDPSLPLVRISDDNSTGNVGVTGSAWVNATSSQVSPHTVTSGANVSTPRSIQLFPNATFVTDGRGLVNIKITSATLACSSSVTAGAGATPSASASYNITVDYWTTSGRVTQSFTWNSSTGTGTADPLAAINPATVTVYQSGTTTLHLSDYISTWNTPRKITEQADSGVHQLSGIVSIATQPVRAGDPLSSLGVQVGNLACVADDGR